MINRKIKLRNLFVLLMAAVLLLSISGCAKEDEGPKISCTVSIDCRDAFDFGYEMAAEVSDGGVILPEQTVSVAEGTNVYELLEQVTKEAKIPVAKQGEGDMLYVDKINSLGTGDCGASSGWVFTVNGDWVEEGCGVHVIQDGDVIVWSLYCEPLED